MIYIVINLENLRFRIMIDTRMNWRVLVAYPELNTERFKFKRQRMFPFVRGMFQGGIATERLICLDTYLNLRLDTFRKLLPAVFTRNYPCEILYLAAFSAGF